MASLLDIKLNMQVASSNHSDAVIAANIDITCQTLDQLIFKAGMASCRKSTALTKKLPCRGATRHTSYAGWSTDHSAACTSWSTATADQS